jgi:hypothetical protein
MASRGLPPQGVNEGDNNFRKGGSDLPCGSARALP